MPQMNELPRTSTLTLRQPAGAASRSKPTHTAGATGIERSGKPVDGNGERAVRSDTLLQGRSHVSIMHNGETYQLRATRLGKLILTK